ncbi:hypothetical protein GTR00_05775, partial [Kineococcus sp. T90]|nr:hypothetical protein [Kineococcus indalonis]
MNPVDRGHLRGEREVLPTVPELLATDALLDRLGAHRATEGDLGDTVVRLLDAYALHADPETAGVRPVQLPRDLRGAPAQAPAEPAAAPRVLVARRRTLERLGRGAAASAAVLALLGGTAAAAATGGHHADPTARTVQSPVASVLPGWFPDEVMEVLGGTVKQRVDRELDLARADARSGRPEAAVQRVSKVLTDLRRSGRVRSPLVEQVESTLQALQQAAGQPVSTLPPPAPGTLPALVAATTQPAEVVPRWVAPMAPTAPALPGAADGSGVDTATPGARPTAVPSAPAGTPTATPSGTPAATPSSTPSATPSSPVRGGAGGDGGAPTGAHRR